MLVKMNTMGVPPPKRTDYWQQRMLEAYEVDCDIIALRDPGPQLRASVYKCSSAILSEVQGDPIIARRRADPAARQVNLIYSLEGDFSVRLAQDEIAVPAGSLALFSLREDAEYEFSEPFRHFSLLLDEDLLDGHAPNWRNSLAMPLPAACASSALLGDFLNSLLSRGVTLEAGVAERIVDGLASLLASLLKNTPGNSEGTATRAEAYHRQRIRRHIADNLRNPQLNIDLVASQVGLSARYVHRLFAGEDLTLMAKVRQQRLAGASRDLASTEANARSISEVAFSWGFNDLAHFSRSFRQQFGVSPREWRDGKRPPA